jgi:methylenetetrahydrofolate dehydrogenase (NADP+)/methenyltetrahydrofolate cyclohydrolase
MILDGKKLASEILARAKARAEQLPHAPLVAAVVASDTPATRSYLAIKEKRAGEAGCVLEVMKFPESASTAELAQAVSASTASALIVQLPLPEGVDTHAVLDAIPVAKDADVLSSAARNGDLRNPHMLLPPVVGAIREILASANVELRGKKAVVIGEGFLVGNPAAVWLRAQGAEVEIVNIQTSKEAFSAALGAADVIISGAGSPGLIKPEMIENGVVLIDAGTSESSGKIVGDADPTCAEKCLLFTPVPGGVGPVAVACLFANAVELASRTQVASKA